MRTQQAFDTFSDAEKAAFWSEFSRLMKWRTTGVEGALHEIAFKSTAKQFVRLGEQLFLRHGLEFEQYT